MMRIYITAPFDEQYIDLLKKQFDVTFEPWSEETELDPPEVLRRKLEETNADIFILESDNVTAEVLDGLENLKVLCVCRATPSNVDVDAATRNGIIVTNTPGRNAISVAELVVAMMVSVTRYMFPGEMALRSNQWDEDLYFKMRGIELNRHTVGLLGFGAVAREVAIRLKAFNMQILAYDPYVDESVAAQYGAKLVDMETLLAESDYVSNHLPVTPATEKIIDAGKIALMKPTAYFVNTARAATINEADVIEAIKNRRIAGGAFDVYGEEPLPPDSPYMELDNTMLLPHLGGSSMDVVKNHSSMVYEDIANIMEGKAPVRFVNRNVAAKLRI